MVHFFLSSEIRREIREFTRLTIPLASAQVAQAATGFVDTVMMGWLGQEVLAGGALAAATFGMLLISATGMITGVSPLIAEAYGAANLRRIQQLTYQGLWLTGLVSLPVMLLLSQMGWLLPYLGQATAIANLAESYLKVMVWGFFPALLFALLKNVVSSLSEPRPIFMIVAIGSGFNAIANYILGFGALGLPSLGLTGIALASALTHWGMAVSLLLFTFWQPRLKTYQLFSQFQPLSRKCLQELVTLGLPIGVAFSLEVGLFTATTYLMGLLGTEVLAAHQIVFQTIVVIFMVPLGMSFATTIRVGQWRGQQQPAGVRRAAYVGMALGGTFMTLMAIALLLFPTLVISLYLDVQQPANAKVVSLAVSMLGIAAISQILDGVQTTAAGALRGLKDTRVPMSLSFFAFWGVGLASGYYLGFHANWGGVGLWIGQCLGVATAAGVFIWRFYWLINHPQVPCTEKQSGLRG